MGTVTMIHTNKLYLPHKWARVGEPDEEGNTSILVNPVLMDDDVFTAMPENEMQAIIQMWSSQEDGAITKNPGNLDCIALLDQGFLSTVKGL